MGILPPPKYPLCCQAATKKLTFSTTSVLLLLNVPLSLSRGTVFRQPKNPRRAYRPKIAGILFVCNEPEGKYYTVPGSHFARLKRCRTRMITLSKCDPSEQNQSHVAENINCVFHMCRKRRRWALIWCKKHLFVTIS